VTRIAVLGAGLVGGLIARDLAAGADTRVLAVDNDREAVNRLGGLPGVDSCQADLSIEDEITAAAVEADLVVVAVPGFLGARVSRCAIHAGRPVVDISFSPEDPWELDGPAREHGVPVVVDCGVAPGLSNFLAGRSASELDEVDEVLIYVGGLPARRFGPWEYGIVFSPTDVIELYTRPSRLVEDGKEVVRPALSDREPLDLPGVGRLEAFNTDGLRTLLRTIPARTMKEKTLRYPGHAEKMQLLRDTGFLDERPLRVGEREISPRALTQLLLFRAWKLPEGEEEITVLRVVVSGSRSGRRVRTVWDLLDRTDPETGTTSMARTTGFPCAAVARLIAAGRWTEPGMHPPEVLGRDPVIAETVLRELSERGVRVERRDL
jgi:saccharopine dehydrogenase-like NADP-dependent oxidoreductase